MIWQIDTIFLVLKYDSVITYIRYGQIEKFYITPII